MRRWVCIHGVVLLVLVTGASGARALVRAPNLVGQRLDVAVSLVERAGLRARESCSGLFGCIILSHWEVCSQTPRAGHVAASRSTVTLFARRPGDCL